MKKKIVAIVMFVVMLVFPMLSWPLLYKFESTAIDENRTLAGKPTFGLKFFSEFESYFLDRAPYRSTLIKTYNKINNRFSIWYEKLMNLLNIPYYRSSGNVVFGSDNWLFFQGDSSLDYYQGINPLSTEIMKTFATNASKVTEFFKSKGKEFVIIIPPTKEIVYSEYMPKGVLVVNSTRRNDIFADFMAKNSSANFIYAKDALLSAKQYGRLYYKQDTHWNSLGAYYGCREIFKKLNIDLVEAQITSNETLCVGDLTKMATLDGAQDYVYQVNYKPEITLTQQSAHDFSSTNTNGKHLFLMGDSFRENMRSVLYKEFETVKEIHTNAVVIDEVDITDEIEAADVVILEVTERYDYVAAHHIVNLLASMYNL